MVFASREDAGHKLGRWLQHNGIEADLVLGLPRGGVVVAAEVAEIMHLPLGVLIVRKIGHPRFREFALGALAEGGVVVLDQEASRYGLDNEIAQILDEELQRLLSYQKRFARPDNSDITSRNVLIVDDGLATGSTTEAAIRAAIKQGAVKVTVAAPVASLRAIEKIQGVATDVQVMIIDPKFEAVGRYYEKFPQTTDEEVSKILRMRNALSHDCGDA